MKLGTRELKGVVVLEPKGKIMGGPDATMMKETLHEMVSHNKKKVVIDLAGVEWMNSTGLGILISSLSTIKTKGGELRLANLTEKIESLLTITKLITVFDTHDSVEEAVDAFFEG
jgi:anti-sigma B factor antagonist